MRRMLWTPRSIFAYKVQIWLYVTLVMPNLTPAKLLVATFSACVHIIGSAEDVGARTITCGF